MRQAEVVQTDHDADAIAKARAIDENRSQFAPYPTSRARKG
ncbi:MAG TPA: hypothetical protein VGJ56_10000 [Reyranella sp.]